MPSLPPLGLLFSYPFSKVIILQKSGELFVPIFPWSLKAILDILATNIAQVQNLGEEEQPRPIAAHRLLDLEPQGAITELLLSFTTVLNSCLFSLYYVCVLSAWVQMFQIKAGQLGYYFAVADSTIKMRLSGNCFSLPHHTLYCQEAAPDSPYFHMIEEARKRT